MTKEGENMDGSADYERFIDFFAEMIEKYGADVLDEIEEAEESDSSAEKNTA